MMMNDKVKNQEGGGYTMRISSISYLSNQNNRNMYRTSRALASGKRINSAADNAAGLAIANKLNSRATGTTVGVSNAQTSQNMLNIADGAIGSVTDSLQRIRELSIQASNGLYSDSDRSAIQAEIDQLKEHIGGITSQTKFNEMNVLDGSMGSSHVASNADGGGMNIDMPKFSLKELGIADYDVTSGNFDVADIDKALEKVSSKRSYLGASYNGLDHTINYNNYAAYNLTSAQSRIEDTDYARGTSEMKKQQVLNTYNIMMQRKLMNSADGQVRLLMGM